MSPSVAAEVPRANSLWSTWAICRWLDRATILESVGWIRRSCRCLSDTTRRSIVLAP